MIIRKRSSNPNQAFFSHSKSFTKEQLDDVNDVWFEVKLIYGSAEHKQHSLQLSASTKLINIWFIFNKIIIIIWNITCKYFQMEFYLYKYETNAWVNGRRRGNEEIKKKEKKLKDAWIHKTHKIRKFTKHFIGRIRMRCSVKN